ncbi:MAG TPA: lytic transglycosylase domain-containing protein [Solirubrobacterales bacterium]|nr:lytic transglycosylase domain-containing protein [Solirubrobacterales bacterium]
MKGSFAKSPGLAIVAVPLGGLLVVIAFVTGIAIALGGSPGSCGGGEEVSGTLKGGVPEKFVPIYRAAAGRYRLGPRGPAMLASIHFNETSFGTNTANTTGSGAEGQMMFMPETWAAYGVDADGDGRKDPRDPDDAINAAARYLRASGAPGNWHDAIFAYNHAEWYVDRVFEDARRFQGAGMESVAASGAGEACGASMGGDAMLRHAQRLFQPRAFKPLPGRLMADGRSPEEVDARIWPDAVWLLEHYGLRVTAAREGGHQTHGDGTAMDLVPAPGRGWDGTAKRAAEDLGWTEGCGASGTAPVCPLAPAIQFVGYNGYPLHGDPRHSSLPHLHVSWKSSGFGSCPGVVCGPDEWVMVFPLTS